jgi:hypothetical protein
MLDDREAALLRSLKRILEEEQLRNMNVCEPGLVLPGFEFVATFPHCGLFRR